MLLTSVSNSGWTGSSGRILWARLTHLRSDGNSQVVPRLRIVVLRFLVLCCYHFTSLSQSVWLRHPLCFLSLYLSGPQISYLVPGL